MAKISNKRLTHLFNEQFIGQAVPVAEEKTFPIGRKTYRWVRFLSLGTKEMSNVSDFMAAHNKTYRVLPPNMPVHIRGMEKDQKRATILTKRNPETGTYHISGLTFG